jgi:hypothetical protein
MSLSQVVPSVTHVRERIRSGRAREDYSGASTIEADDLTELKIKKLRILLACI